MTAERPIRRVGFAGTPVFAATALEAVIAAGFDVPLVLSQPDRPAGRGMQLQAAAVKQAATAHGIAVVQPSSLRLDGRFAADAAAARQALLAARLDVLVVAAYGLILPPWVLELPRFGCLNIHGSLLPRWRGAAPIQRAIEAGDRETGVAIMQMDAGLDTGAVLLTEATPIGADDTSASLHERLATSGARLLVRALREWPALTPVPQPLTGISYAAKIGKAEAAIDWQLPAAVIERRLRAFDPFPGCTAVIDGHAVKLWRGAVVDASGAPGQRLPAADGRLVVACGEGALEVLTLQQPGARRIDGKAWRNRGGGG